MDWLGAQRPDSPDLGHCSHMPEARLGLLSDLGGPGPPDTCGSGGGRAVKEEIALDKLVGIERPMSEDALEC